MRVGGTDKVPVLSFGRFAEVKNILYGVFPRLTVLTVLYGSPTEFLQGHFNLEYSPGVILVALLYWFK